MAATYRIGRARRNDIPKQVYLPEARASANAVGQILVAKYGQHPWILQIMEMVQSSVDRGLQMLSGSIGPSGNGTPGDIQVQGYAMPARTGPEVMQANPNIMQQPANIPLPTQQQVAQGLQEQDNDMFAVLSRSADPAMQQLGQGIPNQPMPQPMQQAPVSQTGLVMPPGMAPQEAPSEGTSSGHDSDSVSWLL